ncbi:MAG: hypothetical protein PHI97_10305 [Desulfobulbus sp.]|nr:hypothetical protein [Desulfobulbus sp.]
MVSAVRQFAPILGMAATIFLWSGPAQAADTVAPTTGTAWDSTVNALIATGMYGASGHMLEGVTVHLQKAENPLPGVSHTQSLLSTQAITFSYEGSAGLLEFSAGYILSQNSTENKPGSIFLGIEPDIEDSPFNPERSWYLALDLSRSYQIDDDLALSFGNRALLLKNPFDTREGHLFSLLFSMPITYKNYLTITPELQWTRPLSPPNTGPSANYSASDTDAVKGDVFYGGVSISFSY